VLIFYDFLPHDRFCSSLGVGGVGAEVLVELVEVVLP